MKIFQGKVTGMKMAKTISVDVERFLAHPLYKKRFKRSKKYQVHSENEHKIGDVVKFVECPPISKTKRWIEVTNTKKETKVVAKKEAKTEVKRKAVK